MSWTQSSARAFTHLYQQAQLIDVRSKEDVVVFTLFPTAPHIDVLDFADNLIERSIAKGRREALGGAAGSPDPPHFQREIGRPVFWIPGA